MRGERGTPCPVQACLALATAVAGIATLQPPASAGTIAKTDTGTTLAISGGGQWSPDQVPTSTDIALFGSNLTVQSTFDLGGDLDFGAIQLTNPANPIIINGSSNLTLQGISIGGVITGLQITAGAPALTLNSGLQIGQSQTWNVSGTLTVNGSVAINTATLTIADAGNVSINNFISGSQGITKTGGGTLALTASNSYLGGTLLSGGLLVLDFSAAGAPSSGILFSSGSLNLGGGSFSAVGKMNTANSQTFANTFITTGAGAISAISGASGTMTLALGNLRRTTFDGVVVFNGPASGAITGAASSNVTTASGSGLIWGTGANMNRGAFATYGLYDYAALSSGKIVAGSTVANFYTLTSAGSIAAGTDNINWDVNTNAQTNASITSVNTLRFDNATANSFTINTTFGTGGILITPDIGPNNVTFIAQSGNMGPGRDTTASEMVVWQNNTQGELILNPILYNGNTTTGNYVFAGPGTTLLDGLNTYAGQTTIEGGMVVINSASSLGAAATAAQVNLRGGGIFAAPSGTTLSLDNSGNNRRPINLAGNGTFAAATGKTLAVTGSIIGSGSLAIGFGTLTGTGPGTANATSVLGNGTVTLSASNSYTGGTTITGGATLQISNLSGSAIGSGPLSINAGTLTGNGIITGSTTVNAGSHYAPGSGGVGTITLGAVSLASGSFGDFEVNGPTASDLAYINGNLAITSGAALNLFNASNATPVASNGTYNLFEVAGNITINGAAVTWAGLNSPGASDGYGLIINNSVAGATYLWGVSTGASNETIITLSVGAPPPISSWIINGSGGWSLPTNWSAGMPNDPTAQAMLNTPLSAPATVTLDGNKTLQSLQFNATASGSAAAFTLAPGTDATSTLTISAGGSIQDLAGNQTITAPITLAGNAAITVTRSIDTLTFSGGLSNGSLNLAGAGTLLLTADNAVANTTIAPGATLQIGNGSTSGTLSTGNLTNNGNLVLNRSDISTVTISGALAGNGALSHIGSGTTTLAVTNYQATGPINVAAGRLVLPGGPIAVVASNLTIAGTPTAPTATLDIKDGGLVIPYTDSGVGATLTSTLYAQAVAARGVQDPFTGLSPYNQPGLTSSTAAFNNANINGFDQYGVGVINNADIDSIGIENAYTSFMGQPVGVDTVLIRYTYMGDVDLDGKIDANDVSYLINSFNGFLPGYSGLIAADFDDNGIIDANDVGVLVAGFDFQGSPLDAGGLTPLGSPALDLDAGPNATPEPASLMLLGLGAIGFLRQRKRRHL